MCPIGLYLWSLQLLPWCGIIYCCVPDCIVNPAYSQGLSPAVHFSWITPSRPTDNDQNALGCLCIGVDLGHLSDTLCNVRNQPPQQQLRSPHLAEKRTFLPCSFFFTVSKESASKLVTEAHRHFLCHTWRHNSYTETSEWRIFERIPSYHSMLRAY